MDSKIAALLATNEAPSDEVMASARSCLAKSQAEFAGTDAEVQRIEHALRDATSHRNQIQDRLQLYQTVLSPIRRLPDDVLCEIFLLTLPTIRNPIINAGEAPLLLTHICSTWRAVALSSPRIWARFHISFPGNELSEDCKLPDFTSNLHSVPRYDEAMARRCAVVQDWLLRSGGCALSLSILYPFGKITDDEIDKPAQRLLQTLLSHIGRWKELELSAPLAVYNRIRAGLSNPLASQLQVLRIRLYDADTPLPLQDQERPMTLLPFSKLRHLEVDARSLTSNFVRTFAGQQWENVSNLVFHSPVQGSEVLGILKLMPNLVHCKLQIDLKYVNLSSNATNVPPLRSDRPSRALVHLPHLESLSIHDYGSPTITDNSLGLVEAPSLKRLEYHRNAFFRVQTGQAVVFQSMPCAFTPLLETCAPTLQALAWSPSGTTNPVACLQTPGRLRRLVMGRKDLSKSLQDRSEYWGSPFDYTPILACLVAPESMGTKLERESSVLLPYLQDLEVYQVVNVSDELVLQVIRSRLLRYSQGRRASREASWETVPLSIVTRASSDDPQLIYGIAALRKVVIVFERRMQVDIKPEVEKLAKEAGIPFHLELSYVPHPLPRHNPLSTSYGLSDEGTTWRYSDF